MKQPTDTKQRFSSSDKVKIIIVSSFLAILLIILGFLIGLLLRQSGFRLSMLIPQSRATSIAPALVVSTPDCSPPTLVLGTETLQIQIITPAADGSLTVPLATSGIAYWVEGTSTNYAFVLSPTEENIALLSTLIPGSTATATWSDCDSTTYNLSAPQESSLSAAAAPNPSSEGIVVFVETDPSGTGFALTGELTGQEITTFNTPSANEVQAEIGLLETTASADGKTVTVVVSIQNYGSSAITLTAGDVVLSQPDGAALALESSKPRLPEKINVGDTKTLELTFPRPTSPIATLRIFTVEYDIEDY
jgi:hypothetical protein